MLDYLDVIYLSGGQSSSMRSSLRQEKKQQNYNSRQEAE